MSDCNKAWGTEFFVVDDRADVLVAVWLALRFPASEQRRVSLAEFEVEAQRLSVALRKL